MERGITVRGRDGVSRARRVRLIAGRSHSPTRAASIASHSDIDRIAWASRTERISSTSRISCACWCSQADDDASGCAPTSRRRDEAAARATGLDQPERLEARQRLAQHGARDAESLDEHPLGREPIARHELPVQDLRADLPPSPSRRASPPARPASLAPEPRCRRSEQLGGQLERLLDEQLAGLGRERRRRPKWRCATTGSYPPNGYSRRVET